MMDLFGKILDSINANFHFLNRHNSPSTKMVFKGPVSLPLGNSHNTRAKENATNLWESVVMNMQEAPFILEQGINRKWLSDQLLETKVKFEKYKIHFPVSLKEAFENWFYSFQTAFRTKDLYETHKMKDILETEIQQVIDKND